MEHDGNSLIIDGHDESRVHTTSRRLLMRLLYSFSVAHGLLVVVALEDRCRLVVSHGVTIWMWGSILRLHSLCVGMHLWCGMHILADVKGYCGSMLL